LNILNDEEKHDIKTFDKLSPDKQMKLIVSIFNKLNMNKKQDQSTTCILKVILTFFFKWLFFDIQKIDNILPFTLFLFLNDITYAVEKCIFRFILMNFSKLPLLQCTYQVNICEYELNYCKLIENDAIMTISDNVNKAIENPSATTKVGEFKNSMIIKPTSLNSFKKVTTSNRIKGFNNSISIGRKPTTELSD